MKNKDLFFKKINPRKAIKLIVFLWLISSGVSFGQISLSFEKTTLKNVIEAIKKQSPYKFFYEDFMSNISVTDVSVKDKKVNEVLDLVLKDKGITYVIEDNVIYLSAKDKDQPSTPQSSKTVSGGIVDAAGDPLVGVSVVVKGTTMGTMTDMNGKYTISIPAGNNILEVSYLGYITQKVDVLNKTTANVTMFDDTQMIDEVVVTALGIKREKKMLGYSMQEVKADQLNEAANPSAVGALQGKVAGLQMNISPTGLNGSTKITLRGNKSFTDNNQPLWVIDGVPFSDENNSSVSLYGGIDRGGASVDLNPADIESISVLKGANASALYGSRAMNGVILVTTKRAKKAKGFGVDYSTNITWTNVSETLETQKKYGQGLNGAYSNTQYSFGGLLDGSPTDAWWQGANGAKVPYQYNGNHIKDYFNTGFSQNHNVSFGNTSEKSNYRASFGYLDSKGVFEGEKLKKVNFDLTSGTELNNYVNVETKISLSKTQANDRPYIGKQGEMYQLLYLPNNIRLSDLKSHYFRQAGQSGQDYRLHQNWYGPTQDILNPYFVNQQRSNMDERLRVFGYHAVNIKMADWLKFRGRVSLDYYRTKILATDLGESTSIANITEKNEVTKQEDNYYEMNSEFLFLGNYNITPKIRIDYTFGGNRMNYKKETLAVSARNTRDFYLNSAGLDLPPGSIPTFGNEYLQRKIVNSLFGSFQIAYDQYLSLDATARNDWSSALPPHRNSYFYPSVNLSFIASEFMQRYNLGMPEWIDFAKVRLSYAEVGNDTQPYNLNNYKRWTQTFGGPMYPLDHIKANSDLKPEISHSYEVGLDMKFFKNRLGFDFTYYHATTINQIMQIKQTSTQMYSSRWINAGEIINKGYELSIYSIPVVLKDFEFGLDVNLAHNSSQVKKLAKGSNFIDLSSDNFFFKVGAEEGGSLGDIFANRVYDRDSNGKIIVTSDGMPRIITKQRQKIGSIEPDLLMSVSPKFKFKNITLSALFDMRFGGDIISVSEATATNYGMAKRTLDREGTMIIDGVTASGQPNTTPISKIAYYQFIGYGGGSEGLPEEFIYSASYIKLRELAVGYSFPQKILGKTPLTSLRLSFVARNLFYLLKHTPGTSPEGGFDTSMYSQAFDFAAVPSTRTLGFSINVGF